MLSRVYPGSGTKSTSGIQVQFVLSTPRVPRRRQTWWRSERAPRSAGAGWPRLPRPAKPNGIAKMQSPANRLGGKDRRRVRVTRGVLVPDAAESHNFYHASDGFGNGIIRAGTVWERAGCHRGLFGGGGGFDGGWGVCVCVCVGGGDLNCPAGARPCAPSAGLPKLGPLMERRRQAGMAMKLPRRALVCARRRYGA